MSLLENNINFSVFIDVTRLLRHSVKLMNSQSMFFCLNFLELWLLNSENTVSFTDSDVQVTENAG